MKDLNFALKNLCLGAREGSYSTQAVRYKVLMQCAAQLDELGYGLKNPYCLKPKHVTALVSRWQREGLTAATLKNRMIYLRWWADKVGKVGMIASDNAAYGIADREISKGGKAWGLDEARLNRADDTYTRLSLRLQEAFGLRREESIKFSPSYADKGDYIQLKASWTKGGKPRVIPITTPGQRALLDEVRAVVGSGALIPPARNYIQQLKTYENQCLKAGIANPHGLRHGYAQRRYEVLAGWKCPAAGGPATKDLSPEQRARDEQARRQISKELGHERLEITRVYLG